MKGVLVRVLLLMSLSFIPGACSSSGDDLGGLQESLEDRLTDALEFESDELRDGAPPAGKAGETAPQLAGADIPGGMAVETGFVLTLEGSYANVADIEKAVVFVYGASRYFLIDVLPIEVDGVAKIDLIGRLGQDDKLIGQKFTFKLALQNNKGVTGQYIDLELTIGEAIQDETLSKVNLFDDEYHESGRPEGSPADSAPQISAFTYPEEVSPGGEFRLNLRTSFATPEIIKSAIMSTPHSAGYREYFTEAVTLNGKLMSDSLVVVDGTFSEELDISTELVFIIALRQDNGETGMYRSFKVKVVEPEQSDGDEEQDTPESDTDGDIDEVIDGDYEIEQDAAEEDITEPELEPDEEIEKVDEAEDEIDSVPSSIICYLHSGVVGAMFEAIVGLQDISEPVWSQNISVPLNLVSQVNNGTYTTYEYSLDTVPPGHYRAMALMPGAAGAEIVFPDNFYWAAEGPQLIQGGQQKEFNIWSQMPVDANVTENIFMDIQSGVNAGTVFVPDAFVVLTLMPPETIDLALTNVIALRRVSAELNGYAATLRSIPSGSYFVSMWIDRCVRLDLTDDVFHFDWVSSIVVPQPIPSIVPELPFDLAELNCPMAPAVLQVPAITDFGTVPTTGSLKSISIVNNSTGAMEILGHAATSPFYSNADDALPYILNSGQAWSIRLSIGSGSAGPYEGMFYLLADDPMHPVYTSALNAILVK